MEIRNRIFDYSQEVMKESLKSFADSHKKAQIFKKEVLNGTTTVGDKEEKNILEIVKRIEDFATVIKNCGFDQ